MRHTQHRWLTLQLLLLLLAGAACAGYDAEHDPIDPALGVVAPGERAVIAQHVKLRSLVDGSEITASNAILMRRSDGLSVRVRTRQLGPGELVDVFWAIFNEPAACENPNPLTGAMCTPPDLFVPATGGSLHHVATLAADAKGRLAYTADLTTGSDAGCVGDPFPCATLTNPTGAEVHSPLFVPNGGPGRQAAQFLPIEGRERSP